MSEFSDLLSSYIDEKEIKVYSLLEYCNLDRSTMYKIINGKRNPTSEAVFQKIAEFLHLTPVEYRKFKEAYLISKIGKDLYYKRKYTEKYLVDFPKNFSGEPVLFLDDLRKMKDENEYKADRARQASGNTSGCAVVSTHLELNHLLYYMISLETQKTSGKIALLLQPDYGFLLNMLSSLKPAGKLKIEHTFCISKTNQMTENHEIYNLMYLNKILPLYFSSLDYHPYYFYEDIFSHYYSMNGLSCMVLTSEFAITCNSEYTTGIFYKDPAVVSMLWSLYDSYQDKCQPLFYAADYLSMDGNDFDSPIYKETPSYVLQPEACMVPFVDRQILDAAIVPEFPDRETAIGQMEALLHVNQAKMENGVCNVYFTKRGLADFAAKGLIKEIPEHFYRPLTVKERIRLMERILPCCRNGNYRLLKKPLNQLSDNLHLCVNNNFGYLLFNNIHNRTICLIINEASILTTFMDYLSSLDDSGLYTAEETTEFVYTLICELKKKK